MKLALSQKILRMWVTILIATFAVTACIGGEGDGRDAAGIESNIGAGGEEESERQEEGEGEDEDED